MGEMYEIDHTMDTPVYDPVEALYNAITENSAKLVLGWNFKDERRIKKLKKGEAKSRMLVRKRHYLEAKLDLTLTAEDCDNDYNKYYKLVKAREKILKKVATQDHLVYNPTNPLHQFNDEMGPKEKKSYDPQVIEMFIDAESFVVKQKIDNNYYLFIKLLDKDKKSIEGKYSIRKIIFQGVENITDRYLEPENIYVVVKNNDKKIIGKINNINFHTSMKKLVKFIKNNLEEIIKNKNINYKE